MSGHCRTCQVGVEASTRFCPTCGELYPAVSEAELASKAGPLLHRAGELMPLAQEKARLAADLEALIEHATVRQLSGDERIRWEQTYTRWREVTDELTERLNTLTLRKGDERRAHATYPPGQERRSRGDRRDPFWNRIP
jgi:hypothetical protein